MTEFDWKLLREIGLVGYLLLACFLALVWMVRRLVEALIRSQETTAVAIRDIAEHEVAEKQLLERIDASTSETMRTSAAHLEIARQWQQEGTRRSEQ